MKNYLKGLVVAAAVFSLGVGNVNAATAKKTFSTGSCETVYTNYYFFLEANTYDYLNQKPLSQYTSYNKATFNNNYYQTYFNSNKYGYGQTTVTRTSSTNSYNSMSLSDFYYYYTTALKKGGAYTNGTSNYIVGRDWYRIGSDGKWTQDTSDFKATDYSIANLMQATISANAEFTNVSNINYYSPNPFSLEIERKYTGYLDATPVKSGENEWFLHPAVYYVRYCSERSNNSSSSVYYDYVIEYDGNGTNVTNVPSDNYFEQGTCTDISNNRPSRTGYTFLGWSTDKNASAPMSTYAPGKSYCQDDLVLYAVWEKNSTSTADTYTVTYNENTGDVVTNMPANVTLNKNEDIVISNVTPVRNGYTFMGWSTDKNATVGTITGGSVYSDRKDIVLYAIWQKNGENNNNNQNNSNNNQNNNNNSENQKPGLPENPATGVMDYLVPFAGTIAASGAGLSLLKRKKSFKQF